MRLRFTIRDLLWLTVAAAILVSWWLDRSELKHQIEITKPFYSGMIQRDPVR
jgi:hypothetical protein